MIENYRQADRAFPSIHKVIYRSPSSLACIHQLSKRS